MPVPLQTHHSSNHEIATEHHTRSKMLGNWKVVEFISTRDRLLTARYRACFLVGKPDLGKNKHWHRIRSKMLGNWKVVEFISTRDRLLTARYGACFLVGKPDLGKNKQY